MEANGESRMFGMLPTAYLHDGKDAFYTDYALYGGPTSGRTFEIHRNNIITKFRVTRDVNTYKLKCNPTCRSEFLLVDEQTADNDSTAKNIGVLIVQTDDFLLAVNDTTIATEWGKYMDDNFNKVSHLGLINRVVGIAVTATRDKDRKIIGYSMDQGSSIQSVIEKFAIPEIVTKTPMDVNFSYEKSTENDNDKDLQTTYRSLYASLLWINRGTRCDINYEMVYLGQFIGHATHRLLTELRRVAQFLWTTIDDKLVYTKLLDTDLCKQYTDADANLARDPYTGWSYASNMHFQYGNLVHWETLRVQYVEIATAVTEYVAIYQAAQRGMALQNMAEVHDPLIAKELILIRTDATTAEAMCSKPTLTWKLRHLRCRYFAVRDWVSRHLVNINRVESKLNTSDIGTKPLDFATHFRLRSLLLAVSSKSPRPKVRTTKPVPVMELPTTTQSGAGEVSATGIGHPGGT